MGSNKNDMPVQFSKVTELEIVKFCLDHSIDPSLETQYSIHVSSINEICGTLSQTFFLEVLKYYRLSLGQLALVGVGRIMFFEILCRALSYEPSLVMFRRFFSLFRNGDWYTIEKTQCEGLLLRLRSYRAKLRAYLEELLVVLGIIQDWVGSDIEPIFCLDRKDMYFCVYCMSALRYILLGDPSGVEIEQREIHDGGPSIVRRTEHVRTAGDLESVPLQPIMDGSFAKKLPVPV
ncbi:hypothetical protein Hanom_Chr01g00089461 [Helianthus anomalus]